MNTSLKFLKKIDLIVIFMLLMPVLKAQISLTYLYPKPHSNTIYDIYMRDSLHIYTAGKYGEIGFSIDGGQNWVYQYQNPKKTFRSIAFADNNTGICCGDSGIILRTTNGGQIWNIISSGTYKNLNEVFFKNNTTGYIVGSYGTILYTTDGGATWTTQTSGTTFDLTGVRISANNKGYIVGSAGTILKTSNGTTWTSTYLGTTNFNKLYQINDVTVIVVGNGGTILKTTNSGSNWTTCTSNTTNNLYDISFIPGTNTGFAGAPYNGPNTLIFKTTDGGLTWTSLDVLTIFYEAVEFRSIFCLNNSNIIIAGSFGYIYKVVNLGTSFNPINQNSRVNFNSIYFPSANIGYVVGENGALLKTHDAGDQWTKIPTGLPATSDGTLNDVYFFNDSTGIAVGNNSTILSIYHGGDSLSTFSFGFTGSAAQLNKVIFVNRDTGFICSTFQNILRTIDKGASWQFMNSGTGNDYRAICFPTKMVGYFGGYPSTLRKTEDCGMTWTTLNTISGSVEAMDFLNVNKGVLANSSMLTTANGGLNWSYVGDANGSNSIKYQDNNNVFSVGSNGIMKYSNNGGSSWSFLNSITESGLNKITFAPSGKGYIVGDNGTIIRLDNNVIVSVEDSTIYAPPQFLLYPNPAKDNFYVKLNVLETTATSISVFDYMGRSVYKKEYGILQTGDYKLTVLTNALSPGIYIVKVSFEKYSYISKIIIVK